MTDAGTAAAAVVPSLDMMQTLGLAGVTLLLGQGIRKVAPVLARYNLPGPVLGGLAVATVLTLLRRDGVAALNLDTSLQTPLMVAFFTALGFGASARLLRAGGPQVLLYLVACTVLAVMQNVLGAGLAWLMGLPPLAGVLAGSVTLTGGPGTGMAFAPAFEKAGVHGAASLAVAAAMGGIVLGGLLGSPVGTALIGRHRLQPSGSGAPRGQPTLQSGGEEASSASEAGVVRHLVLLLLAMGLGAQVSLLINKTGITLPLYIGGMVVAAALRNLDDVTGWLKLDADLLDRVGSVALTFFLAMALMTLKLWELVNVAGPLLVMLASQAALMVVAAVVMFRLSGRDYDAAVMSAGLLGFMMGTTANAMANMDALTRRYGPAPRAYLVVPMVGACFIDFTNSVLITGCLNLLSP
jgi:ESS family glutamate:Na+ symporter